MPSPGPRRPRLLVWQGTHADFFEPDDVARFVDLQADVARLRAFGFAPGLIPDFPRRQVFVRGVEFARVLAVEFDADVFAMEGHNHGVPTAGPIRHFGGRIGQRINRAGAMQGIAATENLHFVAVVDAVPNAFFAIGGLLHLRGGFFGRCALVIAIEGRARIVHLVENPVVEPNIRTLVGTRLFRFEDDAVLPGRGNFELLVLKNKQTEAVLRGRGAQGAIVHNEFAVADVDPGRIDFAAGNQRQWPPGGIGAVGKRKA
jgi:hypothetical protein